MLHAFIHARKLRYHLNKLNELNDHKLHRVKLEWDMEQQKAAATAQAQAQAQANPLTTGPNMLPSPASSSTPNSSNSTPLGGHGASGHSASPSSIQEMRGSSAPGREALTLPPAHVTCKVNAQFIWENKSQSAGLRAAIDRIRLSEHTLNLPVMARHFPRTFARMINTSLSPLDEHEPDFQDDECELYWPGQAITGDGLGWACLMGMSMVKEFGRDYGYQGVDGVIPRMSGDENLGHTEPRFDPRIR